MNHLKKLGLFVLLSTCTIQQAIAQEKKEDPKLRYGIKGGFNISTLSKTKDAKMDNARVGFNAGVFAKVPLMRMVAIQPEFYFATKGATVTYDNLFVKGTVQYNLNYVELPVFVVVNITPNLNVHAGPYGSILLSGKETNESNVSLFDFENNINKNNYSSVDAGLAFGGGLDIGALSFGVRYYQGFSKVGKQRAYPGFDYTFPNAYNSVFNAYLNFSLN